MAETNPLPPARPLFFVNYAAGSLDAKPHRHAVFTHVQRSWKHWMRAEEARALEPDPWLLKKKEFPLTQVRWKLPQYQIGQGKRKHPSFGTDEGIPEFLDGTLASQAQKPLVPNPIAEHISSRSPTKIGSYRKISPLSLVQEGNSDPFNVFAVPIDPINNALMKYTRDMYLPGIQGDLHNPGSPAVQRDWTECVTFLQDECLASAHLSRIASIVASDPDLLAGSTTFQTQALALKMKTMTILRERLIKSLYDTSACKSILMLLNAEIYAGNLDAAKVHALVLARLLQSGSITKEPIFLFKTLYHDTQRAIMSFSRPSFDFEHWVPAVFNPIFNNEIIKHVPHEISPEILLADIDPSMDEFPALKRILATLKHCLLLSLLGFKDPNYATLPMVMYGRVTATIAMGRLINHYLDFAEAPEYILEPPHRMQAYISLTTLLWLRAVSGVDNMKIAGNTRIFAANAYILDTLEQMLMNNEADAEHSKVKLWVLYTSACIETLLGRSALQDSWLVKQFLRQAIEMNLNSWAEVKDILQGFLFTELLPPNGSTWCAFLIAQEKVLAHIEDVLQVIGSCGDWTTG